ncbi:zinc-binding dehydrogenase [Rhizorhabdus argentea]|uniref:zinc-binding dehydrogenase n=1 Tax=Rhizorhabdus argentea TaxID=1387174 RepID=UPI0030EE9924
MSQMMLAGVASPDGLTLQQVPVPQPDSGQILVKVYAAGLNRADLNAAKGAGVATAGSHGKPIGMEWSGEIVALGAGTTGFAVGDRVACSGTGGYAEFAVTPATRAIRLSGAMDLEQAAVLPLALMTADNALRALGSMSEGDAVLVHGGSSAVGQAAIQIARLLGAGHITATARNAEKRDRLAAMGADLVLDPANGWTDAIRSATGGKGANVIIDMITGPQLRETMMAAAVLGRVVNVGRLGGLNAEIDLDLHSRDRISLIGATFRTRSIAEISVIVAAVQADIWPLVEQGRLALPIDRSFRLADAVEAQSWMAADRHFGKILLRP